MTMVIWINDVKYLPIRGVPFVTGGALPPSQIANMIVDYERFCDADHDSVVSPFKLHSNGTLLHIERSSFGPLLDDQTADLPPGVIVRLQPVRDLYDIVVRDVWVGHPDRARPAVCWDEDPVLSLSQQAFVYEGLPIRRINSRSKTIGDIRRALRQIDADLRAVDIHLDFDRMPGKKADWTEILGHYVARVRALGVDAMDGYYKALQVHWNRGGRISIAQVNAALHLA